jgi:hypothetical protein
MEKSIVRSEHATVALSDLQQMPDEIVIPATIAKAENAVLVTGECLAYLREAKTRFDNRGRVGRDICGYVGWQDFVERGLGKSLRTVQRQILESAEPERIEERKEKARIGRSHHAHNLDEWLARLPEEHHHEGLILKTMYEIIEAGYQYQADRYAELDDHKQKMYILDCAYRDLKYLVDKEFHEFERKVRGRQPRYGMVH